MDPKTADKNRKRVGKLGETVAAEFLVRKGFTVLDRNFRKPWGEIDIIAERTGTVHFVEVKTVSRETFGDDAAADYRPEEQVHPYKLKKIQTTAELYMQSRFKGQRDCQIDVIGVLLNERTRTARCRLFENVS